VSTESTIRSQIEYEYQRIVLTECSKVLREQLVDANIAAISKRPDITVAEREQAIGYLDGIARALELVLETEQRMFKEDE